MAIYLRNINFPVYPLSKKAKITKDGPRLIVNTGLKEYILDDLSISGESLGIRRLHIKKSILYPLRRRIETIGNLLLYTKIYNTFIDSSGKIFNYNKTTYVPLIYRKILAKIPYNKGTMLYIESVHCPIWYYRKIEEHVTHAVLLYIEKGYIILGVTANPSKRKRFKI